MPSRTLRRVALAFSTAATLVSLLPARSLSQERPDPSAIGNGPRALGMAHAVTAVTDDLASIGWNPAGLSFLDRAEIGIVSRVKIFGTGAQASTNNPTPTGFPRFSGDGEFAGTLDALEFGGVAVPFTISGRTIAVGVAYRRFAEGLRVGTFKVRRVESNGRFFSTTRYFNEEGIRAISPTVAVELTDRIRVGVTANLLSGETKYVTRQPAGLTGANSTISVRRTFREQDYAGLALQVGTMVQLTEKLRLGLQATLPHDQTFTYVDTNSTRDLTRAAPLQLNVGLMRRMSERSFISADVHLAPWSTVDLTEDATGNIVPSNTGDEDATGLHIGYERDVTNDQRVSAVRFGVFARTTSFQDLDGKQVGAYGATVGQSWHWERWSFEGGVLLGRSTEWLRSRATESNVTLANTDFIVSLGLKRRF